MLKMYPGIELRLLRYAVAVADELSFSRAAEQLRVAQPSLSKQIRDLEEELGTKLFYRTRRVVRITPAGSALVNHAREALRHSEQALHAVKALVPPNRFSLGYSPYVNHRLVSGLRSFAKAHFPNASLSLTSAYSIEQLSQLKTGELDAALVLLPLPVAEAGFVVEPLAKEPLLAVLPARHRLARKREVRLQEMHELPLILFPRKMNPVIYDGVHETCVRHGLQPRVAQEVTTFPEALALSAEGVGFTFARECHVAFRCPGIVFRPIVGEPLYLKSGLAYSARRPSAIVAAYISFLHSKKPLKSVDDWRKAKECRVA